MMQRRVTLTVAAATFVLVLDSSILNTSLPAMAAALGVRPLVLSVAVTSYLLAVAAVLALASWLGDRFGLRRVFVAASALFTGASLLCGVAQDLTQLVLARLLQGVGAGLMFPVGRTLAMQGARKQDLIGINALLTWPMLIAPVLGPPLGGFVTTYFSWRWNFLANVPLGLAAIVLTLRWVPRDAPLLRRPLDVAGTVGAALGLMLFLGGLEWISHALGESLRPAASITPLLTAAAGIAALAWTVRHLRRTPYPVVSLAPFEQRSFLLATAGGGTFVGMCLQATPFLLPLYFQVALGRSAVEAGALLFPYFLGNLLMKAITTPILMRFGFRRVLLASGWASAATIAGFALAGPDLNPAALVLLLVAAGCVRSMLFTALNTVMYADVPAAQRGAASSLSTISGQVAQALGVSVGSVVLVCALLMQDASRLGVPQFQFAFVAMGLVCALATASFLRMPQDTGAEMTGRTAGGPGG